MPTIGQEMSCKINWSTRHMSTQKWRRVQRHFLYNDDSKCATLVDILYNKAYNQLFMQPKTVYVIMLASNIFLLDFFSCSEKAYCVTNFLGQGTHCNSECFQCRRVQKYDLVQSCTIRARYQWRSQISEKI